MVTPSWMSCRFLLYWSLIVCVCTGPWDSGWRPSRRTCHSLSMDASVVPARPSSPAPNTSRKLTKTAPRNAPFLLGVYTFLIPYSLGDRTGYRGKLAFDGNVNVFFSVTNFRFSWMTMSLPRVTKQVISGTLDTWTNRHNPTCCSLGWNWTVPVSRPPVAKLFIVCHRHSPYSVYDMYGICSG